MEIGLNQFWHQNVMTESCDTLFSLASVVKHVRKPFNYISDETKNPLGLGCVLILIKDIIDAVSSSKHQMNILLFLHFTDNRWRKKKGVKESIKATELRLID